MEFGRITDPQAWKQAMAGLLRRGGEVGEYVATAPEKAGQAILDASQRQSALMNEAFDPTGKTLIRNPQAANQAAMNLFEGPLSFAPAGITAWHGSPHIFDKFDMSKVGTGEGAQAYGHGMYFAEAPQVAGQYAKELGTKIDVNGKPLMEKGKIVGSTGNTELDDFLVANLGDVKATRKDLLQSIKEVRPTNPEGAKDYQKLLADLRKANVGTANTGNLYKVDIPDEHIPMMLDWDKPLSQQPKNVQEAFKKFDSVAFNDPERNTTYMQRWFRSPSTAKQLEEMGYKGFKYLDQASRGAEKGTSNFVVFDPTDVKILERNNQLLSRKELIKEQLDKITK